MIMIKKILASMAVFALAFGLVLSVPTAKAAKFVDGTWTQSASPGTTAINFTNTGALSSGDKIVVTFPSEATVNNTATLSAGTNSVTGQTTPTFVVSGQQVTITLDGAISGSTAVTISMSAALSAYTDTTYAQQSLAINTLTSTNTPVDYGVSLITNDNATMSNITDVTATVALFVNMAVDTNDINLGVLSSAAVSEEDQTYTVNSNNTTGVQVQITSDGDLDSGTNTIDACAGTNCDSKGAAAVTAGQEEYGIQVDNLSGFTAEGSYGTADQAIPTSATDFVDNATTVSSGTFDVNYKASIDGSTVAGVYDQEVTMTIATKP